MSGEWTGAVVSGRARYSSTRLQVLSTTASAP